MKRPRGRPGSMAMDFRSERISNAGSSTPQKPELRQGPVQLTLVSPQASYFKDSDLLVMTVFHSRPRISIRISLQESRLL